MSSRANGRLPMPATVICFLLTGLLSGSQDLKASTEASAITEFSAARRSYLAESVARFNREQLVLEKQLTWELHSIGHCLKLPGARGAFDSIAIQSILRDEVRTAGGILDPDAELGTRVNYWIENQRADLVYRLLLAEDIRRHLLASLTEEELSRQFGWDLRQAVRSYADADFLLSSRVLSSIRKSYPYRNVDDLLFFEGESCFAENLFQQAATLYRELLREHPESVFRGEALRHLLYVDTYFGLFQSALTDFIEFDRGEGKSDWETAYIMGIVYFQLNNISESRKILAHIPVESSYYYRAMHLIGTSWILDGDYNRAIGIFEQLLALPLKTKGLKDVAYMREDARIKLGHLYFEAGQFEGASRMFSSIDLGSEWYDDALIGQAWSDLSLNDFNNAYQRSADLAEHLPDSEYLYEATTLAGYAAEQMEQNEQSAEHYGLVLDHAERGEKLRVLMGEQGEIQSLIRRVAQLEQLVFVDGDSAYWQDYLQIRRQLKQSYRRVKYSELATASSNMSEFIDERQIILQLKDRMAEFKGPRENWDSQTQLDYLGLREQVIKLMGRIRVAGLIEIRRSPVVLRENQNQMSKAVIDSLIFSSNLEMGQLKEKQEQLDVFSSGQQNLGENQMEGAVMAERFSKLRERLDRWRVGTEAHRNPPFSSDLPHWSNLAFSRLVLGEIRFEELEELDSRILELENYLEQIDGLLEDDSPEAQQAPAESEPLVPEEPAENDDGEIQNNDQGMHPLDGLQTAEGRS